MENTKGKKILVISHQLSRTGAPIVLLDMINVYRKQGYQIDVISMLEGELRKQLEEWGVSVKIQDKFIQQPEIFYEFASQYDLVIANTLLTFEVIYILNQSPTPVIWWLHEGRQYFEYFHTVLPNFKKIASNIHVLSVGHYVQDVIREMYGCETDILHFGLKDVPRKTEKTEHDAIRFLTAGTYSKVKAQDVLVQAIRLLPKEYLDRSQFLFCGNEQMVDEEVFLPVKELSEEYANVELLHQLSHDQMLEQMEKTDVLVVPSRVDPIPTVAAEMMMKEGVCLCTSVCGIAHYIENGINGYTVAPDDAEALRDKIIYLIDHQEEFESVGISGRKIYEDYFSQDVFEPHILRLAEEAIGRIW